MKYAVIQSGGKQYRVAEGDVIIVERLPIDEKSEFVCSDVLLVNNDGVVSFGDPFVKGFTVKGSVVSHKRDEKVRVAKFKSKVRYRKVIGHRQSLSEVQITAIGEDKSIVKANIKQTEAKRTDRNKVKK